jgi:hypothetical protein
VAKKADKAMTTLALPYPDTSKGAQENTMESVASEWLLLQAKKLSTKTMSKAQWMLETFVYPRLRTRPIANITASELLGVLRTERASLSN